jgi:CRISPR/Cas system CSM-associated protein Csm3 (group 7 of RAMP superfamily)
LTFLPENTIKQDLSTNILNPHIFHIPTSLPYSPIISIQGHTHSLFHLLKNVIYHDSEHQINHTSNQITFFSTCAEHKCRLYREMLTYKPLTNSAVQEEENIYQVG